MRNVRKRGERKKKEKRHDYSQETRKKKKKTLNNIRFSSEESLSQIVKIYNFATVYCIYAISLKQSI